MDIIIPTCDKYLPIVEANLYGINHFWKDHGNIIILGYSYPKFNLPKNVRFVSLGKDETPSKWSDGLKYFFDSYDKSKFILHMDDHCLVAPVRNDYINMIEEIMSIDDTLDKVMLHPFSIDLPLQEYKSKNKDLKLFICEQNYGSTTLMPAIWKTSYIKKLLKNGLDPHSFELQDRYCKIENKTLSTHNEIMMISSLINGGVRNKNWHICWHRKKFVFDSPDKQYVSSINNIINQTQFQ